MPSVLHTSRINYVPQRSMWCLCGRPAPIGGGPCRACLARHRWDRVHFGGQREMVLRRDGRSCRGCGRPETGKWSIAVHHRHPGLSRVRRMITLCPGCHAVIHRTLVLRRELTPLLQELWREQHPDGHEQRLLDFNGASPAFRPPALLPARDLFEWMASPYYEPYYLQDALPQ